MFTVKINGEAQNGANSLFQNTLPVTPYFSKTWRLDDAKSLIPKDRFGRGMFTILIICPQTQPLHNLTSSRPASDPPPANSSCPISRSPHIGRYQWVSGTKKFLRFQNHDQSPSFHHSNTRSKTQSLAKVVGHKNHRLLQCLL